MSVPTEPFENLDFDYTSEEHLQHIEARVIFPLQRTTDHEYILPR